MMDRMLVLPLLLFPISSTWQATRRHAVTTARVATTNNQGTTSVAQSPGPAAYGYHHEAWLPAQTDGAQRRHRRGRSCVRACARESVWCGRGKCAASAWNSHTQRTFFLLVDGLAVRTAAMATDAQTAALPTPQRTLGRRSHTRLQRWSVVNCGNRSCWFPCHFSQYFLSSLGSAADALPLCRTLSASIFCRTSITT